MPKPFKQFVNQILCGDAQEVLSQIPDESIDCVVTSPPYWALRDYGMENQLGLEPDFELYIEKLCCVFDEVKRVLKTSGTCWVNLGDTYSTRGGKAGSWGGYQTEPKRKREARVISVCKRPAPSLPGKCLLQIPSRFAIAMINRGWILRNEIIWFKPNCMPSSVKDRLTMDFEKIFFFVKSRKYYFEQQFEPLRDLARESRRHTSSKSRRKRVYGDTFISAINPATEEASRKRILRTGRNKRCVWTISTRPYRGNHFAVYPAQLVETPIKAGCPKDGVVLDPFIGSGTTALVARMLGRNFIGIELNSEYVQIATQRLAQQVLC